MPQGSFAHPLPRRKLLTLAPSARSRYVRGMLALHFALLTLVAPTPAVQDAAGALQARLDAFIEAGRVPGISAGVVLPGGRALALASGLSDREAERDMDPEDRLLAGSVGKTFVSALALQLVAEGTLELDGLAGEHLGEEPWFERLPNAREITLRHLLGHRSGVARYVFAPEFVRALEGDPERSWDPAEQVGFVLDRAAPFPAGEGFAYADTNYLLAAMVLERASGGELYALVRARLLEPRGLTGIVPSNARRVPGLVPGYAGPADPLGFPDRVLDEEGRYHVNPAFEWAGGGFATSGGDLARWARALYAGDVLDEAMRAELLDGLPAPALGPGMTYGLGAMVSTGPLGPSWGHSGFMPGYMTEMRHFPEVGVTVAVLVNTSEARALPVPLGRLVLELAELASAPEGSRSSPPDEEPRQGASNR